MVVALARKPTAGGILLLVLLTISVLAMGISFRRNGRRRLGMGGAQAQRSAKQLLDAGTAITITGAIMLVLLVVRLAVRR